ncbi:hypothetical protein ACFO3J_03870 [Streptomyces polygonati]|uniref:DUF4145 domain-containing protein n=1 Tax=Streptomyces polygonati TaxID=1617087 RepID=A0ABV8HGG1_9ACTN
MSEFADDSHETQISPDAKRDVEEVSRQISDDLILRARLIADGRGSRMVERGDIYLASRHEGQKRRILAQLTVVRSLIVIIPIILVTVGFTVVIHASAGLHLPAANATVATVSAALGAAIAAATSSITARKTREAAEVATDLSRGATTAIAYEIASAWSDLEMMLQQGTPQNTIENFNIRELINSYTTKNNLPKEFSSELLDILRVRNRVVHRPKEPLTNAEAIEALDKAFGILKKMEELQRRKGEQTSSDNTK